MKKTLSTIFLVTIAAPLGSIAAPANPTFVGKATDAYQVVKPQDVGSKPINNHPVPAGRDEAVKEQKKRLEGNAFMSSSSGGTSSRKPGQNPFKK